MSETIETIIQWHRETFPDATQEGQKDKFLDERWEFLKAETLEEKAIELADMFIVACGMARFDTLCSLGCIGTVFKDMLKHERLIDVIGPAIEKKMAINRKRQWNFTNGQYQHKESTK